jgi:hypothetical protein
MHTAVSTMILVVFHVYLGGKNIIRTLTKYTDVPIQPND